MSHVQVLLQAPSAAQLRGHHARLHQFTPHKPARGHRGLVVRAAAVREATGTVAGALPAGAAGAARGRSTVPSTHTPTSLVHSRFHPHCRTNTCCRSLKSWSGPMPSCRSVAALSVCGSVVSTPTD